jgi:hypothetical protein
MKKLFVIPLATLALVGCAAAPAVQNDVAAAEVTLTAAERLALIYTTLPPCGGAARICSDQATKQHLKDLDNQAFMAVKAARQNSALLSAALSSIAAFRNAIPMGGN